jgi:hypothetical protein
MLLIGLFARGELAPGERPCIALGESFLQIAADPAQAELHVGFTDDPRQATVRVQILDSAESADFAMVDDSATEPAACGVAATMHSVAISARPQPSDPLIYLSRDGDADYRIFVSSKTLTAREAAALIVGAGAGHGRISTASLAGQL